MNDTKPTDELLRQYGAVEQVGYCDMLDMRCVAEIAAELGYHALSEAATDREVYRAIIDHYQREGRS